MDSYNLTIRISKEQCEQIEEIISRQTNAFKNKHQWGKDLIDRALSEDENPLDQIMAHLLKQEKINDDRYDKFREALMAFVLSELFEPGPNHKLIVYMTRIFKSEF